MRSTTHYNLRSPTPLCLSANRKSVDNRTSVCLSVGALTWSAKDADDDALCGSGLPSSVGALWQTVWRRPRHALYCAEPHICAAISNEFSLAPLQCRLSLPAQQPTATSAPVG
uniref:Uncharacterized protein n=1 Tax=Plectus sambesii TaxID=2011161 RepID=A0A914X3S6_9BILA